MNDSFMDMVEREYVRDQYEQLKPQIQKFWLVTAVAGIVTLGGLVLIGAFFVWLLS